MNAAVTYEQKLDRYAELEALKAAADAEQQQLLGSLASDVPSWMADADAKVHTAKQWAREEVAAIARVSPQAAGYRMRVAVALTTRFPATLQLVAEGRLWFWHARFLADETFALDDETAAAVEARVLPRAAGQSLGEFKAAVRRAIKAIRPADAEAAHQQALAERGVWTSHDGDGMATITVKVASDAAEQVEDAIEGACQIFCVRAAA